MSLLLKVFVSAISATGVTPAQARLSPTLPATESTLARGEQQIRSIKEQFKSICSKAIDALYQAKKGEIGISQANDAYLLCKQQIMSFLTAALTTAEKEKSSSTQKIAIDEAEALIATIKRSKARIELYMSLLERELQTNKLTKSTIESFEKETIVIRAAIDKKL